MPKVDVAGAQNVEVSKKLPIEKTPAEQLELMEAYTRVHSESLPLSKEEREINCLRVLYPSLFRSIEATDWFAGRLDFLPIGFGSVTSVGGVGHYCVFDKLKAFGEGLESADDRARVDAMYDYWTEHDTKAIYCAEVLTDTTIGRFIAPDFPLMATARLSGVMLDYATMLELGADGMDSRLRTRLADEPDNQFLLAGRAALDIYRSVIDSYLEKIAGALTADLAEDHRGRLETIAASLRQIRDGKAQTFHQAIQQAWLFALLAGCINYGRLDDYVGPYLVADLKAGRIDEQEAHDYLVSLWTMIENRRTTVNGRIIVGGYGRRNPEAGDEFAKLALQVTAECKYVEPQFTLRFNKTTPTEIWDAALDCLGSGATFPTLYNDEVNVPAVMYAMRVDRETAEQYVPFGCGEFVIQGQSIGTPNVLINLLKILTITLNGGIDPMDGVHRAGSVKLKDVSEFRSFEEFYDQYKVLLDHFLDLGADAQYHSYDVMNREASFVFGSLWMDDCVARGRSMLDGGIRYLGGTNETYGNINTSDALYAIKKLVFTDRKYTLAQLNEAACADFVGYEALREDLLACDKYGNDLDDVDELANDLYEYVAKGNRQRGLTRGMDYYLIVISNNQTNTEWGRRTAASVDGRSRGKFMNPANNPQGGADRSGPTAMLNSLSRFRARYHGGSVQNIKFTPRMFNHQRPKVKSLFDTYFDRGGCQLMVTVVDPGILEDAQLHPEKYPNLIVRVSGFSAIFVNLDKDVQDEVISRELYGR
ncbi:MAG: pyruvate formate lyase family protein [Actinobacteria bacterium]|nr:pyruvate formate lyase family protein [Actinomycetota bacterium]